MTLLKKSLLDSAPVYLNPKQIEFLYEGPNDTTIIRTTSGMSFTVKQPIKEILDFIKQC